MISDLLVLEFSDEDFPSFPFAVGFFCSPLTVFHRLAPSIGNMAMWCIGVSLWVFVRSGDVVWLTRAHNLLKGYTEV